MLRKLTRRIEFKKSGRSDFEGVLEMFAIYPKGVEEFSSDNYFEMTVQAVDGKRWEYRYKSYYDIEKVAISWFMS